MIFWGYTKIRIPLFLWAYNFPKTIPYDGYFLRNFRNFQKRYFQISSSITEAYLEPNRKYIMNLLAKTVKAKKFYRKYLTGPKYPSELAMNFSKVFFCFSIIMGKWLFIEGGCS